MRLQKQVFWIEFETKFCVAEFAGLADKSQLGHKRKLRKKKHKSVDFFFRLSLMFPRYAQCTNNLTAEAIRNTLIRSSGNIYRNTNLEMKRNI